MSCFSIISNHVIEKYEGALPSKGFKLRNHVPESQIKSVNMVSFLSFPQTAYCMLALFFMFSAPCGSSFFYVALFSAVLVMLSVQCTLILPFTHCRV